MDGSLIVLSAAKLHDFDLENDLLSCFFLSYVNHSCAPNCVAEVVTFDKEDKIIIISSRRIPKGEEVRD